MKRLMAVAAMLALAPMAHAGEYAPAECDNGTLPDWFMCPSPYVEMVPPPTGDTTFLQAWHCRETTHSLGLVNDSTGGCGGSKGLDMFPGWIVPEAPMARGGVMSEAEYREAAIGLFLDYMAMMGDGVFVDYEKAEQWGRAGFPLPNKIRGNHPPGGGFGRPPGSDWLKRLKALDDSDHAWACFDIPSIPSHFGPLAYSEICPSQALWTLQASVNDPNPAAYLDGLVAQFWLATLCHENPQACAPYLPPPWEPEP